MAINFQPMQAAQSLISAAKATANQAATQTKAAISSKIDGFKSINVGQAVSQKLHDALTTVGHFLRNVNTAVKSMGLSGTASNRIGKVAIDGMSWAAATVEQTEKVAHLAANTGGERVIECLEKVGHVMGTTLGVTAIVAGVRGLAGSARCYSRAAAMDKVANGLDQNSSVQKQLGDDLKLCADTNRLRGKDKAICGAIDISVGTATLVAGALSSGAAAPFAGLIGWGAGQVAKNSLRAYRGSQDTQANQLQREHVAHRMLNHATTAAAEVGKLAPGSAVSLDNQARIKAFQAAGLVSSKLDITKASPALTQQLEKITAEKIDSKFTENTETLTPEIKPNSTMLQKTVAYANTALLMAS